MKESVLSLKETNNAILVFLLSNCRQELTFFMTKIKRLFLTISVYRFEFSCL